MTQWDFDRCISMLREVSAKCGAVADGLDGCGVGAADLPDAVREVRDVERTLKNVKRLLRAEANKRR